jgi:hypothetical protein
MTYEFVVDCYNSDDLGFAGIGNESGCATESDAKRTEARSRGQTH